MPNEEHVGISQRIEEDAERTRLRDALNQIKSELDFRCGVIARTAAEHAEIDALHSDLRLLRSIWTQLQAGWITAHLCWQWDLFQLAPSPFALREAAHEYPAYVGCRRPLGFLFVGGLFYLD